MRLLCFVFSLILLCYLVYTIWTLSMDVTIVDRSHIDSQRRLSNRTVTLNQVKEDMIKRYNDRVEVSWCFDYDDTLFFTTPVFEQYKCE